MIKFILTILMITMILKYIHKNIKKLKYLKPHQMSAEMIVEITNNRRVRPLAIEQNANIVRHNFNKALQNKDIDRNRILAIKEYLKTHVNKYEIQGKKFKNDAHMIYYLLKHSHSLKRKDLDIINYMIIG